MWTTTLTAVVTGALATVLLAGCAAQKSPYSLTGEEKKDEATFVQDASGRTVPNVARADQP